MTLSPGPGTGGPPPATGLGSRRLARTHGKQTIKHHFKLVAKKSLCWTGTETGALTESSDEKLVLKCGTKGLPRDTFAWYTGSYESEWLKTSWAEKKGYPDRQTRG
eukprot:762058-Hanusia_phi.AAC.2